MTTKKTNIYAVDALRAISILAVVLIHTTTRVLEKSGYNLHDFQFTLFLNQASRFAVPLFFLISGFVLELNHHLNVSYWRYFKKRVNRVFVPYVFWSAIYYLFIFRTNPDGFLKSLVTGSASYQLYFIPSLLIFYTIFPVLHKFYKYLTNIWVLAVLCILEILVLYVEYHVKNISAPYPVSVFIFNYYIFLIGMTVSHNREQIMVFLNKIKYILAFLSVTLAGYIFWQGKTGYYRTYNIDAFYSNWRPSVFTYTLILAGVLFYFFNKYDIGRKYFIKLSKLSFFVFFAHVAILESLWRYLVWNDLIFFGVISSLSFISAYIFHKIPGVYKITG